MKVKHIGVQQPLKCSHYYANIISRSRDRKLMKLNCQWNSHKVM